MITNIGKSNPNRPDWQTPKWLVRAAAANLNEKEFALDCCATAENAVAPAYYTIDDDGLGPRAAWHGTWFCNPPYTRTDLPRAAAKAIEAWDEGHSGALLVPVSTSARWYQRLHAAVFQQNKASEFHFRSRVQFDPPPGATTLNRSNINVVLFLGGPTLTSTRGTSYYLSVPTTRSKA